MLQALVESSRFKVFKHLNDWFDKFQNNSGLSQGWADASTGKLRCGKASAMAVAFSYYDRPRHVGRRTLT